MPTMKVRAKVSYKDITVGIILILCLSCSNIPALIGTADAQLEAQTQAPLKTSTVAELVKPAVIRIFDFDNITLSSPFPSVDIQGLRQQLNQLAHQGRLHLTSSRDVLDALIALIE